MPQTKFCQGISDISDSYMGFLIDTWGVLHGGAKAFEGTSECLKNLRERKKTIILISNSPEKASVIKNDLKKAGIGPSLYDYIVSTGELISLALKGEAEGVIKKSGKKCFYIGPKNNNHGYFDDSDIEIVEDIKDAEFMLISGQDPRFKNINEYEKLLKEAARKRLHAICANPDSRSLIGASYISGPGAIARKYQDYGGIVNYIGKPHQPIFQHCIKLLQQKDVYPGDTVMIGDTMAHDILGASNAMIDTCLVTKGVHSSNFKDKSNPAEVDRVLNILIAQYNNIKPEYLIHEFIWGKALPDRKNKKKRTLKSR